MAEKMLACFRRNKEESWAMRNGKMLLEESISLFDGKVNPIRCISAQDLTIATNNFDQKQLIRSIDDDASLYRGSLRGQEIIVKKSVGTMAEAIRDIVVASRLSIHKNALKLIGCCLETEIPTLVYESFNCEGTLSDERLCDGYDQRPTLAWKHRLKIATDLSNLVAYLHTALPRPLIHRHLKPHYILLDKESNVVKLFNFELCMSLPEGKSFIEHDAVEGTYGYADPEYMRSGRFNEKVDVYAFGVILLELLSGLPAFGKHVWAHAGKQAHIELVEFVRDCVRNDSAMEILDPRLGVVDTPWPGKDRQFEAFMMLALECTKDQWEDRPDMTQVGTRLATIYQETISSSSF